jgi:copper transport protein
MALIDGATGHAIPGVSGAGVLLNGVHVAAMGLWVGALVAVVLSPSPARGGGQGGGYAIAAFGVAVGSGLLLALAHLGFPPVLTTGYGWALVVKVAVVAVAAAVALLGRRRAELSAVAAILAAAAVLVSLPPVR